MTATSGLYALPPYLPPCLERWTGMDGLLHYCKMPKKIHGQHMCACGCWIAR